MIAVFSCETGNVSLQEEDKNEAVLEIESTIDGPVLTEVDQLPEPEGGMNAFFFYLQENMIYPEDAKKNGIEGKVLVEFVVTKEGEIRDVTILKGLGSGCDEAAISAVEKSDKWNPGVHDGKKVNVKLVLPITFKMS